MGNAIVRVNGHAYENEGELAQGGFASVFRVRRGGSSYALKWTRGIGDDAQLQRILLEIQVQRKLQHPNTMRIVEAEVRVSGKRPGSASPAKSSRNGNSGWVDVDVAPRKEVLMVFPLYPRGTLQQHLERAFAQDTPAFSEADCLRVFTLIVEAVLELHARGFAHRDIKPHNVLLTSANPVEPILTDFGSISPVNTTISTSAEAMLVFEDAAQFCSAGYRAPELWESHSSTNFRGNLDYIRADVWSLGCLLYAMAFGPFSPFESAKEGVLNLAIFSGKTRFPPGFKHHGEQYSSPFVDLIKSMLAVDPLERPSIYQLLDKIDDFRLGCHGSKRSLSLREKSLRSLDQGDWADFSVFVDGCDPSNSPQSDLTVGSAASSDLSHSSWLAVSRTQSQSEAKLSRASNSWNNDESDEATDHRRNLSARGRQLLAAALKS